MGRVVRYFWTVRVAVAFLSLLVPSVNLARGERRPRSMRPILQEITPVHTDAYRPAGGFSQP